MNRVARIANHVSRGLSSAPCSASGRFSDPWFRQYDTPTEGFVDSSGFINRLPLRLSSTEVMVHGLVDAKKMWAGFADEEYIPVTCGGKAVVSLWFNNFADTDCGGEYFETWYNTYVSPKNQPAIDVAAEEGPMGVAAHPQAISFLQRVVCGDTPANPGAAQKAINGGRQLWGFSKHAKTGKLSFAYETSGGEKVGVKFSAEHLGNKVVNLTVRLPEADAGAMSIPVDVVTPPDALISCPKDSGQSDNMGKQTRYGTAVCATQNIKPWDPKTDSLVLGNDPFYATPLKGWDFVPILKVHSPDFKIVAFKPVGFVSGAAAAEAVKEHEKKAASDPKRLGAV